MYTLLPPHHEGLVYQFHVSYAVRWSSSVVIVCPVKRLCWTLCSCYVPVNPLLIWFLLLHIYAYQSRVGMIETLARSRYLCAVVVHSRLLSYCLLLTLPRRGLWRVQKATLQWGQFPSLKQSKICLSCRKSWCPYSLWFRHLMPIFTKICWQRGRFYRATALPEFGSASEWPHYSYAECSLCLFSSNQSFVGSLKYTLPSLLWHCWLGVRKSIRPVKKLSDEVLAWLFVWREVQMTCIWSSWCHCHPIVSCFIKIQTGLTFLAPAYQCCPGEKAVN